MCSVSMLAREHGLPISLSITDFNEPKRSIFFMRAIIPPIKCDLEGGEKANPLSNANPAFTQCSVVLAASYLICRAGITLLSPSSPLPRHVAQSPTNLRQYKCDSLMYKLARHMCRG